MGFIKKDPIPWAKWKDYRLQEDTLPKEEKEELENILSEIETSADIIQKSIKDFRQAMKKGYRGTAGAIKNFERQSKKIIDQSKKL